MTIEILAGKKLPHVGDTQWLYRHLYIIHPNVLAVYALQAEWMKVKIEKVSVINRAFLE